MRLPSGPNFGSASVRGRGCFGEVYYVPGNAKTEIERMKKAEEKKVEVDLLFKKANDIIKKMRNDCILPLLETDPGFPCYVLKINDKELRLQKKRDLNFVYKQIMDEEGDIKIFHYETKNKIKEIFINKN